MGFRSWCLGLLAATVIAPVADAAVYRYGLTYVDTFHQDVQLTDESDPENLVEHQYDWLAASEDPWNLPLYAPGLVPGQKFDFRLETYRETNEYVVSCSIGSIMCDPYDPFFSFRSDPIFIGTENLSLRFSETAKLGTIVELYDTASYAGHFFQGDNYMASTRGRVTQFVVTELAPIPLPATIALLPIGLGALVALRRRRKT